MPYVRRDLMGRIESVHRTSSPDVLEYLDTSNPELKAFLRDEFGPADTPPGSPELLRVVEEVLRLFLAKGLLSVDELSHDAQVAWSAVLEAHVPQPTPNFSASGFVEIIDDSAFGGLPDSTAAGRAPR
jgi:hypothetical protein